MFNRAWSGPILGLALILMPARPSLAQSKPTGRWLGQDGYDHCGADVPAIKPNGFQDVHLVLHGLPAQREIASARILGYGSGEWQYNGGQNRFGAVILRKPGATSADVFFEPDRVETGRAFTVALKFKDGNEVNVDIAGGKANPNARMLAEALAVRWVGQDGQDRAGPDAGVGPDGLQDVHLELGKLAAKTPVIAVLVEGKSSERWAFGVNREASPNAEFVVDPKDPTRGSLFFQPARNLARHTLKVTVTFEGGKNDQAVVVAGACDPKLAMPRAVLPRVSTLTVTSRWIGQDGNDVKGRGVVHLSLSGLAVRPPLAAVLSDSVHGAWVYRSSKTFALEGGEDALPLGFRQQGTSADLDFSPLRDESKATLTLRLLYENGESAITTFPGGPCDPSKKAPRVKASETVVRPGDDLGAIVNGGGTVRLAKGNYRLTKPLILNQPVTLIGEPGTILTFAQGASEPPWTTAIKIHAGGTTLRGFAVKFAGPVRWKADVPWGPAMIGTTDSLDTISNTPKDHLTFDHLDLEGPPKVGNGPWEEAVKLMRLNFAMGGRITNNVLRGGLIEIFGGPWLIAENNHRGTPLGTFTYSVFAGHDAHDLVIRKNRAKPIEPTGKVWRFLVLTGRGAFDRIESNVIERVGPRDDDTLKGFNSPEIILTESYHLKFEGKAAAISADGRIVKVDALRGQAPRIGDVVSVVAGPGAGAWRRIALKIEPTTFYLDGPLPQGAEILSIASGFVDEIFSENSVDAREGGGAGALVLAGNHFGTRVLKNRFLGAGDAFRLMAFASETPNIWGWSHVPFFGAIVEGNLIEDSERGGSVGIDHGPMVKTNKGRVYMTVVLKDNIVRWSPDFLSRQKTPVSGITLNLPGSIDPGELLVNESGDRVDPPAVAKSAATELRVNAAILNGVAVKDRKYVFPRTKPESSEKPLARERTP